MKKSIVKALAATSLLLALSSTSIFARGMNRPFHRGESNMSNEEMDCGPHNGNGMMIRADLLGSVSEVNGENKTLKIKDADGNESLVHVNPVTRICKMPSIQERQEKFKEIQENADSKNLPSPERFMGMHRGMGQAMAGENQINLSDVKKGDFVMVTKLGGSTKTLEAGRIVVAREEAAD